jgi:hypothetical protein
MSDNGLAALAAALREFRARPDWAGFWTPEQEAAAILGPNGVFLPDGPREEYAELYGWVADASTRIDRDAATIAALRAALDGLVEAADPALAWMAEKCVPDGAEYAAEGHLFSLSIGELNEGEAIRDALRAALAKAKENR